MADARANFAASQVAVAPSPASSGVTLSVTTGHGTRFPAAVPFNAVASPPSWDGSPTTVEIVRVTAMSGDDVTAMTRAQEGTTAQNIAVGWTFAAVPTKKMIDDLEFPQMLPTSQGWPNLAVAGSAPSAPAAGITLFTRDIAGRNLPAIIGPAGADTSLQPMLGRNKICLVTPVANVATPSVTGVAITATGTATAAAPASTNLHQSLNRVDYLVTTAATTAVAGFRQSQVSLWRGNAARLGGFTVIIRWGPATGVTTSTLRAFVGLMGSTGAPTDVNPSTLVNIIGMGWDAADANVQILHNDGTGTATKIDLGAARASADRVAVYELALFAAPNDASVQYAVQDLTTETVLGSGTITTDLPSNTTFLGIRGYTSVGGTSAVTGLALMGAYIETDL